jgi:hypothetical protein
MKEILDEEGVKQGQTPEEACKSRIYKRMCDQRYTDESDPEWQRLHNFFHGESE